MHDIPVVLGGSGDRMLRVAREHADASTSAPSTSRGRAGPRRAATYGSPCSTCRPADLPTVGRDDTWARVERLRGTTRAAAYAERTHAGTPAEQRDRYGAPAGRGVDTVFLAVADLEGPDDVDRLAPLVV